MALANQYGIDLGNIYETASSLKTAQQLREMRQSKSDEEAKAKTAERNYLQTARPGTTATSIEQQKEFDELDNATKQKKIAEAQRQIEKHGKAALYAASLPIEQQSKYLTEYVSSLPQEEQDAFHAKYKGDLTQALPHIINDLMTSDQLLEQYKARMKHQNALEELGVKGAIQTGVEEVKQKGQTERAEIAAGSRERVAKSRGGGPSGSKTPKPKLLSYEIKTTTDPKTGDKKTIRVNKWDDGTITTSGGNELKPPPPLEKAKRKPLDINQYVK